MRFRITQVTVVEYEVNPEHYLPEATTPEEMLAVDLEGVREDPVLFWNDEEEITVSGEIIHEEEN